MASKQRDTDESSFKADREWNFDIPDDSATLTEKLAYQTKLRNYCENCQPPSRHPFIPWDAPWWGRPYGISPQQQQQLIERQIKRYRDGR